MATLICDRYPSGSKLAQPGSGVPSSRARIGMNPVVVLAALCQKARPLAAAVVQSGSRVACAQSA